MTEKDDFPLIVQDLRNEENAPGEIRIRTDNKDLVVRSGAGGYHEILFLKEETVKNLYNKLDKIYGDKEQEEGETE